MKELRIKSKYVEIIAGVFFLVLFVCLVFLIFTGISGLFSDIIDLNKIIGINESMNSKIKNYSIGIILSLTVLFLIASKLVENGILIIIEDNNTLDIGNKIYNFFIFIGVIIIISIPCFVLFLDFNLLKKYFDLKSVVLFIKIFYSIIIFNYIYETGFDDYYLKITEKASQINYWKFILKWKKSLKFIFRIVYSLLPAIVILIPFHVLIIFAAFFFQEYGEASDKVNGIDFSLKFLLFNQFLVLTALYARDFFRKDTFEDSHTISYDYNKITITCKNYDAYLTGKFQTKIGDISLKIIELCKELNNKNSFEPDFLDLIERLENRYQKDLSEHNYYFDDYQYDLLIEIQSKIYFFRKNRDEFFHLSTQPIIDELEKIKSTKVHKKYLDAEK